LSKEARKVSILRPAAAGRQAPAFRLDIENQRLWNGERAIDIAPKAFAVLQQLVAKRDRLVTKNELLDSVWPGTHVGEAVLTVCIAEIRRAFGDHADEPRFVETVHRRGYRFIGTLLEGPSPREEAPHGVRGGVKRATRAPRSPLVAILDFENIRAEPAAEWLSSGIAETIAVDLKRLAGLSVLSREALLQALAGSESPPAEQARIRWLGETLGIGWVISGAFQTMGDRLRITAKIIDATKGDLVGSAKVDGSIQEIFQMQDRIVESFAASLRFGISREETPRIRKPETNHVQAYEHYARGRQLYQRFGKVSLEEAILCFHKAVSIDPHYALAHSGLGSLYLFRFITQTDRRDLDIGVELLQKALEEDPDLVEPLVWLTYAYGRILDRFEDAERLGRRAVDLEPHNGEAHHFLGVSYLIRAEAERDSSYHAAALDHLRTTSELVPGYQAALMNSASVYLAHGNYARAEVALKRAAELEGIPRTNQLAFVGSFAMLGFLALRRNDLADAAAWFEKSRATTENRDHVFRDAMLALTHLGTAEIALRCEKPAAALRELRKAETIALESSKALGIGRYLVRTWTAMARAHASNADAKAAQELRLRASQLLEKRDRWDFRWIWEGDIGILECEFALLEVALGNDAAAFDRLERMKHSVYFDFPLLETHPGFAALRGKDGFRPIVEALKRSAHLSSV